MTCLTSSQLVHKTHSPLCALHDIKRLIIRGVLSQACGVFTTDCSPCAVPCIPPSTVTWRKGNSGDVGGGTSLRSTNRSVTICHHLSYVTSCHRVSIYHHMSPFVTMSQYVYSCHHVSICLQLAPCLNMSTVGTMSQYVYSCHHVSICLHLSPCLNMSIVVTVSQYVYSCHHVSICLQLSPCLNMSTVVTMSQYVYSCHHVSICL